MTLKDLIMDYRPSIDIGLIENLNFGRSVDKNSLISLICENYVRSWIEHIPDFKKTYSADDFSLSEYGVCDGGPCGLEVLDSTNTSVGEIDYLGNVCNRVISAEVKSGQGNFKISLLLNILSIFNTEEVSHTEIS